MDRLPSERVVLSAPMSFTGSAQRIWRAMPRRVWASVLAVVLIMTAWCVVLSWYCMWGLFLVPYRLVRRSQRKDAQRMLQHRETMQALAGQPVAGPGWYQDQQGVMRWWDGHRWTEHTQP